MAVNTNYGTARTRIKICGLREQEHVCVAVDAGADALGFVLYAPSPRAVTLDMCQALTHDVPAFVTTVALFVNPAREEVNAALAAARIDLLQFHGNEPEAFCASFGRPYISNPDLVERIRTGAEWAPNVNVPASWYLPGPQGYIDYPAMVEA